MTCGELDSTICVGDGTKDIVVSSLPAQVDSFSLVRAGGVVGANLWLLLEEIHPDSGPRLEKAIR